MGIAINTPPLDERSQEHLERLMCAAAAVGAHNQHLIEYGRRESLLMEASVLLEGIKEHVPDDDRDHIDKLVRDIENEVGDYG